MSLTKACILEISELSHRAEQLARGSASDRKQADVILQRIGNLRNIGLSSNEIRAQYAEALVEDTTRQHSHDDAAYRTRFDRYVTGRASDVELRDFFAGAQSVTATLGPEGGFYVPFAYDATLREAMSQVDPVLDETVTSFSMTPGPTFQPEQVSGYDLSTVAAQLIGEATQQTPQTIPPVYGTVLRSNLIFRASFASSWEAEIDIPDFATKIVRAAGVALARRIGQSVLSGRGGTDISGIVKSLGSPSVWNATNGKITLTDISNFYFSVNRFYRAAPKAGWLVTDSTYKMLRNSVDSQNRPLLDVEGDTERLLGKPLYVSPSLATLYSSIGLTGALIFGDLSSIVIRASRPELRYSIESELADITRGQALWTTRCRADAAYFDPSSGVTPPLVLAAIN